MPEYNTYVALLRQEWQEIEEEFIDLVCESSIQYVNPNTPDSAVLFLGVANWAWGEDPPPIVERRRLLHARYSRWVERFRLLYGSAIPATTEAIDRVDTFFLDWVERSGATDFSIPGTIAEAKEIATKELSTFSRLLDQTEANPANGTRIIPDTNALLAQPDFAKYAEIDLKGTIVLVPQVMRELDELKDRGRTPELREAAKKVIRRIKGLRDRGNILDGVSIQGQLKAQAIGREPDFSLLPAGIDRSVPDDRILGTILEYQAQHPNAAVLFVTRDISAQTKAQLHGIPFAETPP